MSDKQGNEDQPSAGGAPSWRWFELLFGGGVIVWALASTITAIWWASDLTTRVSALEANGDVLSHRLETLDNVALGNRITAVETQYSALNGSINKMDDKIDRLLDRVILNSGRSPDGR